MRKGKLVLRGAGAAAVFFAWMMAASCSANSDGSDITTGSGASSGSGGGSSGSGGGSSGTGGGSFLDGSIGDGSMEEAGVCAGESYPGQLAPLDVYVLLDATGSMTDTEDHPAVWPYVTAALIDLASDPMTEGIGIGLTFLPVSPPDGFEVPGSCTFGGSCEKGTCGALAPLPVFVCKDGCTTATVIEDCGLYGPCMPFPDMASGGAMVNVCNGAIVPNVSCDPQDYGEPVVPIAELPGNKDAFVQAINDKEPDGDATPTQPSLAGAHLYTHQWAIDHPTHLVHVLFATDGLPNDCTYNTIDGASDVAKTASEGVPAVPTFVLGLGELDDLDQIAEAGGTDHAYIADGSTVADELVNVFNEIRANGACTFQIPQPEDGEIPDYDRVNVYYTPLTATEKETVKYVGDESECDPVEGGWYFDDPTKQNPTKIILCPATCEGVKLSDNDVEVILGCKTVVK